MISIYLQSKTITYTVKNIDGDPTFAGRITLSEEAIVLGKILNKDEVVEALRKIFRIIGNHNDTLTVVLPAVACNIKTLELPEKMSSDEAKVYANEHAFDLMTGDYEYDHFISEDKITYLYFSREQLELIQSIFKEIGKRIDYFDIPNIGAVREQYFISKNKDLFEVTPACYVFVTDSLTLLQVNEGLFPLTTYTTNIKNYNSMADLINDEAYRLCNFYRWNMSKGKKKVENLYIYNLQTTGKEIEGVTSELTGVKHIINCSGENNAYNCAADLNICLSKALFDPLLAHKIFDLRFRHPFKDTKHFFTAILSSVMVIVIIAAFLILGKDIINSRHQLKVINENLTMVKEKYNIAISDRQIEDMNKKQYYQEYFDSFEVAKSKEQNLTAYVDTVLQVAKEAGNVSIVSCSIDEYRILVDFTVPSSREFTYFKDRLYEAFNVAVDPKPFEPGKTQTIAILLKEEVKE